MEAFSSRVKQLTEFIIAQGLEVPPTPNSEHIATIDQLMAAYSPSGANSLEAFETTADADVDPDFILPNITQNAQMGDQASTSSGQHAMWSGDQTDMLGFFGDPTNENAASMPLTGPTVNADWLWNLVTTDSFSTTMDGDFSGAAALLDAPFANGSQSLDDILTGNGDGPQAQAITDGETSNDEEEHSEVTSAISERLGRLLGSGSGDWRFYGATSNLHLVHSRHVMVSRNRRASYPEQAFAKLQALGIAHNISQDVRNHLIDLYFTWHNASLQIVDQDAFSAAQQTYLTEGTYTSFYSDFLADAM